MGEIVFRGISKAFGAVRALRDVTLSVRSGEAHALVGENGAGKSTLVRILAGIEQPDRGEILWDGRMLPLGSPRQALDQGIGIVHQEVLLFPNLTLRENIFAGRELTAGAGRLRVAEMRARTRALLDRLGLAADPEAEAGSLGIAHRQLLQIARVLAFDCRVLILDEPTTCLTASETADLFGVLAGLRERGVTLIYVSHKLDEVFRLCDRITVLRDGAVAGTFARAETDPDAIVRAMVGRDLEPRTTGRRPAAAGSADPPLLEIAGLTLPPWFRDVSLSVEAGEIVGLFGLVGSGRSELLETIFGLRGPATGALRVGGALLDARTPRDAVRAGVALVPEERHRQGLFFNLSLRDNLLLPVETARGSWRIRPAAEGRRGRELIAAWGIKAPDVEASPDTLSGGNQQKLLLARWLATEPRLLLLDEPTKGVDVGAKYEIHALIRREAERGMGCLVVSSELPELLVLAHRILVMREGRLRGAIDAAATTEEEIMRLATAVAEVRA